MTTTALHLDMTMADILERFPGARRALFQRFHIGGCHSCGYEPSDTLRTVLGKHQVTDTGGAVDTILAFDKMDRDLQIQPQEVVALRERNPAVRFVDVRSEEERDIACIDGTQLLTQELFDELRAAPKDTPIVFHCHHGHRSLDAAAYFVGHGFTNVKSMTGGIAAWAEQVDRNVPTY
jgi:rhodanese-related sulfurtransferase